jgi:hypothetical protein
MIRYRLGLLVFFIASNSFGDTCDEQAKQMVASCLDACAEFAKTKPNPKIKLSKAECPKKCKEVESVIKKTCQQSKKK